MKRNKGFTMLEMLFVIGVIMVLMLLIIPEISSKTEIVRDKGCEALLSVIDSQILLFEINEGYLPSSVSELQQKGYITQKQTVCPNKQSIYISNGSAHAS